MIRSQTVPGPHDPLPFARVVMPRLVMAACILNSLLVMPFARTWAESRNLLPELAWFLPVGALMGGAFVMWGIQNRQRWAWFASLLAFGSLYFGATAFALYTAQYSTGLALLLTLVAMAAGGLPIFCLITARESFFPDEPPE